MTTTRRLWWSLGALFVFGFGVLLWMGGEIHRQAHLHGWRHSGHRRHCAGDG